MSKPDSVKEYNKEYDMDYKREKLWFGYILRGEILCHLDSWFYDVQCYMIIKISYFISIPTYKYSIHIVKYYKSLKYLINH